MTELALWLLGNVVLPDAYSRIIDSLRDSTGEKKLYRSVDRTVGGVPRRVFLRWYRRDETWDALLRQGEVAFAELIDSLVAESERRWFARPFERTRARAVVEATVTCFVSALPPSTAVAVSDARAELRHVEARDHTHGQFERTRAELASGFAETASLLDDRTSFDLNLGSLPESVQPLLRDARSPATEKLVALVAQGDPAERLVELLNEVPAWLAGTDGLTLAAAAELAAGYGVRAGASRLFELAADYGPRRAFLCARAAFEAAAADDPQRASQLVARARTLGEDPHVAVIEAAIAEDVDGIVDALTPTEALESSFLSTLRTSALLVAGDDQDVIDFLEEVCERHPGAAGLKLRLAETLMRRGISPGATNPSRDWMRALDLAVRARDQRRSWRGDSAAAVRLACFAAGTLTDWDRVVALGSRPPAGEATEAEASHADVQVSVAQAHLASGDPRSARQLVPAAAHTFQQAIVRAEVIAASPDAAAEEVAQAFEDAWAAADREQDRVYVWLSAASSGVTSLPGRAELDARDDEIPVLVDAHLAIHDERFDEAITALRRLPQRDSVVTLLTGALARAGRVDDAVAMLQSVSDRSGDSGHLVRAVRMLGEADRLDAAARLAESALARVPHELRHRRAFLHEVLVEAAGVNEAWADMAARARAWIEDLGPEAPARWHHALAAHNLGDAELAWRSVRQRPALQPRTAQHARLWTVLATRFDARPGTWAEVLDLVERFDDPPLAQLAVGSFFRGDDGRGEVAPEVVARYQELLDQHAVDLDDDEDAMIWKVTGTAEQMVTQLRPQLEARARRINEMITRVEEHNLPLGLLAAAAGRPYTACLLQRPLGHLLIGAAEAAQRANEREAALAALGSAVAVDVSTFVTASFIPALWPELVAHFARLEVTTPGRRDLAAAVDQFDVPAAGSLIFDTAAGAVRVTDADPDEQADLLAGARWADDAVAAAVVRDWPRIVQLGVADTVPDTMLPWMSALDMAAHDGTALWCDDVGLRLLAAQEGVPAFGTVALLEALADTGRLSAESARSALRVLREAYATDLPVDRDWLRLSAAAAQYRSGPAAAHFSRPGAWVDGSEAWSLWTELVDAAGREEPARVSVWAHAAALGLVKTVDSDAVTQTLTMVAVRAIVAARFHPDALGACAARIREVAHGRGLPSPVPHLMTTLLHSLSDAASPDVAARCLTSAVLEPADREVVRDLLFSPSNWPPPSS